MNASTSPPADSGKPGAGAAVQRMADNTVLLVALVFLVMGCLGIPLILMSKRLSGTWKGVLVVASLAWTAVLVGLVGWVWYFVWVELGRALA